MPIAFIPNDPRAGKPAGRKIKPHRDRKAGQAGFTFDPLPAEKVYGERSRDFLLWQSREAALRALETWEQLASPVRGWMGKPSRKRLRLIAVAGDDLNAYYNRQSLSFFTATVGGKPFYSGTSTDVVAHETGHALLDSIRPELWDSMYFETGAFHEAFGDCVAILTALYDLQTRVALLARSRDLGRRNFVETTAEDLSFAVRKNISPRHNAATPRHARNRFNWVFNDSLPDDGPGSRLINEVHSFGQVFSGCFYDVIRGIYQHDGKKGERALWAAAKKAGQLLVRAAAKAPHVPRFMQAVGRCMALEQEDLFGGRYRDVVRQAFAGHKIALGASSMLAPRASIGAAPALRIGTQRASLARPAMNALMRHIRTPPKARFEMRTLDLGGRRIAEAKHMRLVDLTGTAKYLAGVRAPAAEPVLLERSEGRAAILGSTPNAAVTEDEVRKFVATLVRHGQISRRPAQSRGGPSVVVGAKPTHEVAKVDGARILRRVRYACGCNR